MSTGPNSWKSKSELRCVVDMYEILVEKNTCCFASLSGNVVL